MKAIITAPARPAKNCDDSALLRSEICARLANSRWPETLRTLKGLQGIAQGRDRRERTLGQNDERRRTLKGFHTGRSDVQPLQGWGIGGRISQGALLRRDPGL